MHYQQADEAVRERFAKGLLIRLNAPKEENDFGHRDALLGELRALAEYADEEFVQDTWRAAEVMSVED